jgi:hypothetical protein
MPGDAGLGLARTGVSVRGVARRLGEEREPLRPLPSNPLPRVARRMFCSAQVMGTRFCGASMRLYTPVLPQFTGEARPSSVFISARAACSLAFGSLF